MKPSRVEIVPARRAGVTGYANVGRGSLLGNPFIAGEPLNVQDCVTAYRLLFSLSPELQAEARRLLDRDWPGGVVRLGCPCNGVEKGQPCHASVIKEFLDAKIARREGRE